jgi:hypothetical protein
VASLIAQAILLGLIASLRPIVTPALLAILSIKAHARARGLALLAGVAAGMVVLCLLALVVEQALPTFEFTRDPVSLIRIAALFGLFIAALGVFLLATRPRISLPRRFRHVTESVDSARHLGPIFLFGGLKTVFNSRMILIALAMGSLLSLFPPVGNGAEIALLIFFLLSLSILGGIMLYFLLRPGPAASRLERLSEWTLAHAAVLLGALSLLIGTVMLLASLTRLA